MSKKLVFLLFLLIFGINSCQSDNSPIIGNWKHKHNSNEKYYFEIRFFKNYEYKKKYVSKSKIKILSKGVWEFDKLTNQISLINDEAKSVEYYLVEKLNEDTLIWKSIIKDSILQNHSDLFLKLN